jgi:serine protease AprX
LKKNKQNKFTLLTSLIFCFALNCTSVFAQSNEEKSWIETQNDTKKLKALQKKAYEFEKQNFIETRKYANDNNIPLVLESSNGEFGKLFTFSIKNKKPIYIYNLDYGAIKSIESDKLYLGNSLGLNIEGQGMLSGVWEANSGALTNFFPLTTHNEFKVGLSSRVSTGYDDTLEIGPFGVTNHATFVCGNLIGNGDSNIIYKGVAPKASILALTSDYFVSEIATMVQAPYNLLVSNHSYGIPINDTSVPPSYFTSIFDDILTAAPYHLAVIAGGNAWMNAFSISKNVLSVGQSFETTNYTSPASVVSPNWFPYLGAPDYRIKPDLVTKSESNLGPTGTGNSNYTTAGGTSFAAPAASGAALLLQQLYKDYHPNFMKSATLKALMCHTTKEAGTIGPDVSFGFGLLDVNQSAKLILNEGINSIIEEHTLNNSDSFFVTINSGYTEGPLKATIAWSDPTSYDSNHVVQLINDLDIYISSISGIELPWGLDTTNPTGLALKQINNRDNIEKIEILNPVAGQEYKIVVKHKGTLIGGSQPFSLIVSGVNFCDAAIFTDLTISAPVLSTDSLYQHAKNNITANNNFNTNSFGKYVAGREVKLTTGFTALNSSSFVGKTGNCIDSINVLMRKNYNPVERNLILFDVNPDGTKKEIFEVKNLKPIIYPNPNRGHFTIIPKDMESGKLNILNQSGQLVFEQYFENESPISVNISDNFNGIYFVVFYAKKGVFTEKIILLK